MKPFNTFIMTLVSIGLFMSVSCMTDEEGMAKWNTYVSDDHWQEWADSLPGKWIQVETVAKPEKIRDDLDVYARFTKGIAHIDNQQWADVQWFALKDKVGATPDGGELCPGGKKKADHDVAPRIKWWAVVKDT